MLTSALFLALCVFAGPALAQNITTPIATPVATTTPAAIALPIATPRATPSAIPISTVPTPPASALSPPTIPPSASSSPPPQVPSPPPPPGAGSQKTAVLSVLTLTGPGLQTFNSTLGDKFLAAMADIYSLSTSSIVIRNWGSSGRRLLSGTVSVGSAALFPNGISAASGLSTLTTAASSGSLQAALQEAGLPIESLSLDSAVTALPSNFQPLYGSNRSRGLKPWAIAVIAVVGALLLVSVLLCCCRSCFCCCDSGVEEGDEKLPKMIKFGSWKGQEHAKFNSTQTFKPTTRKKGEPLPQPTQLEV